MGSAINESGLALVLSPDGNTGYLAALTQGVIAIDISNVETETPPENINTYNTAGRATGNTLTSDGNTGFVANGYPGL